MKTIAVFITSFCLLLFNTGANEDVCKTPGCISIAHRILTNMNQSLDPCEDFYQFTCGAFLNRVNDSSPVDQMKAELKNELLQLLESKNVEDVPAAFIKAQHFYQSCLDEDTVNKRGLVPMKMALIRYGGWPVITPDWKEEQFDWIETTKFLSEDGHGTAEFAELKVLYSPTDTTKNVLTLWSPYFEPSDYAGGDESKWYIELMVAVAQAFGACKEKAEVDMMEIFEFEKKLCNISQNDDRYNTIGRHMEIMTVYDLNQKYPYINWNKFADAVMGRSVKVTSNDTVFNELPSYFEKLGDLFEKTSKRLIANYLLWNVVLDMIYANSLDSKTMLLWKRYNDHFGPYNVVRKDFCFDTVTSYAWGAIVGPAYVHRYISPVIKQQGLEMMKVNQKKLIDVLQSQDWMDDETKTEAERKINNIILDIGYPDEFTNYDLINKYSQTLEINKLNFYENTFNSNRWYRDKQDVKLHRPFNKTSWEGYSYVTDFNAYYYVFNVLRFMAPLMKDLISSDWPEFLKAVSFGPLSGHELTHAIDNKGSKFDSNGNQRNWWTNVTRQKFDAKVEAIVAEYSSYFVKEANQSISGNIVADEMIAEHGGYKLTRKVLEDYLIKNPSVKDSRVTGLEKFTPKQMAWLVPASYWCQRYTTAEIIATLTTQYVPNEYRVNVPLRNSPYFAKDWNCPENSWMNKKDKINVW